MQSTVLMQTSYCLDLLTQRAGKDRLLYREPKSCRWGRVSQVVDCREAMGMGKGGGMAQRGTISECRFPDVIVVGMSPGRRHVTKPVCDITSALRQQGVEYSISTLS